jgi:hypothetical protein
MKKLIVLLLALAMAGTVFAQATPAPALTFGAYADLVANLYDSTAAATGSYSLYTETYFNYKAKDMAFSATTVGGYDIFAAVRNYSLTYNLLPSVGLVVKAGKLREAPGRQTSYIDGNGFSTRVANVEEGVELYASTAGLSVGVFSPIGTNGYKVAAGLTYAVPNLVTVAASYRMVNSELAVGASLTAVKGLTAKVGFKNVGTTNMIYATAGSSSLVKGIDLGLDADYNLTTSKYGVEVKAEYAMAPYALGVVASYDNGDAWYAANGFKVNPYLKWNFAAGDFYVGVTYNAVTGAIQLPFECELSF